MTLNRKLAYLLVAPSLVCIGFVSLYPLFTGIYLSFTNYSLLHFNVVRFIGLSNYRNLILNDSEAWGYLLFTLMFTFGTTIFSYLLGLFIAHLTNIDFVGRSVSRALILLPWVIPPVVAANSFHWMLNDQTGIVNETLSALHLIKSPILFLATQPMARATSIAFSVWKSFPFMALVLLAGLQSIPMELYESASIDGAGTFVSFFRITLPMLGPVTKTSTILMTIWTFTNFENVYLLTKGGPVHATEVLSIYSYNTAFFRGALGYASSITVVMLVFMLVGSQLYMRFLKSEIS